MGTRGVLIDIDGVLTVSWRPIPGAARALELLRGAGLRTALLTNTTSRTRADIAATLRGAGFDVTEDDVLTAPTALSAYLAGHHPGARCRLINDGDIRADLEGVELVEENPDLVVTGGGGPEFDYATMDAAFNDLRSGARLVAMHRNMYWRTEEGMRLDAGAFVVALERAAGVSAEVVGKPAEAFFTAALERLGLSARETAMVGDDVVSDVLAAQRLGIRGVLVRTGKFEEGALDRVEGVPDHVVGSFADVPALLGADEAPSDSEVQDP
ncbi:HAD family hydrolase [Nocardiopsis sp. CNR-923]|uniref:TIGR01458 family HAD-type hydrolase n=1 Tax=Nocardiopsis sp. CNR-923 TaxID=1904965 RepID=UPI0009660B93|nr:TIGR01458 family HAD-type hydrolase [Nocardiopsis sp. CNR-923]OLT29626.1 HAD family hydrolase [Nocardiopsis sp. CNR-923]